VAVAFARVTVRAAARSSARTRVEDAYAAS
jgi:hypothetical protein